MKNLKLIVLSIIFFIAFTTGFCFGQEKTTNLNTPQRAAEGQTKWMISQLKLDPDLYKPLYKINLKYQSRSDSVHSLSIALSAKKKSYLQYSQTRSDELKKVLSANQFAEYQKLMKSIKADAKPVRP